VCRGRCHISDGHRSRRRSDDGRLADAAEPGDVFPAGLERLDLSDLSDAVGAGGMPIRLATG
jgi:hypothetical protein